MTCTHGGRVDVIGDAVLVRTEVEAVMAVANRGGEQLLDVFVAVGWLPASRSAGAWVLDAGQLVGRGYSTAQGEGAITMDRWPSASSHRN